MQIVKDIFNKENTYYISSEELGKDIEYILQNNIKNVGVNLYKDYSLDNIDRLIEELPFIEKLHIGCRGMNLEPLSELKKLQFLSLMDDNYNVDFSGLENLKHLFFTYDRSFKGLEKLINLDL